MNLTGWYPKDVAPVRRGVYEVRDEAIGCTTNYAYWDGKKFGFRVFANQRKAFECRSLPTCLPPRAEWRGIEKP